MAYRIAICLWLLASASFAADFYVSTTGNDATGDGSIGSPYATLVKAVDAAHTLNQPATQKNIYLRGGAYYNVAVALFWSRHDNTTIQSYPGESAILYGGQLLTNAWTDLGDGTWSASLGAFPNLTNALLVSYGQPSSLLSAYDFWCPRTLLVNGQTAKWATYPLTGKLHYTSVVNSNLVYTNTMTQTTNNELCLDGSWEDFLSEVTAINTGTKTLTMTDNLRGGRNNSLVTSYLLRNGPEGMLEDNTFWWDKTNAVLHYRPVSGQNPNTLSFIVPTTTRIMYLYGYQLSSCPSNIVISNLTFACTTPIVAGPYQQNDEGGTYALGALTMAFCTNCIIDGCTFYGIGGAAIGNGADGVNIGNIIRNCVVHDCGSIGMSTAGPGNVVSNNLIYNCGLYTQAGVGIRVGSYCVVCNNTVTNINGAGVVVSGYSQDTTIKDNWIDRCVKRLMDMGAVYGYFQTNIVIEHNFVGDVTGTNSDNGTPWDWFQHGIYSDENSVNVTVSSNVVFNCSRPIHNNDTVNSITYNNNLCVDPTASEDMWLFWSGTNQSRIWFKNITLSQAKVLVRSGLSPTNDINITCSDWRSNIVWAVNGDNASNPTNATSSDPLLVRIPTATPQYLEDADFGFQAGSPCPGLGIQPLSLEGIGYNGGLQHRLPDIKVSTLRVGNMRMAQ